MQSRKSMFLGSLLGLACAGAMPVSATEYDDQAQYVLGYEACKAGEENDDKNPQAYQAGCADALAGNPPKHASLAHEYYPATDPSLDQARLACRQRHIEGTNYKLDDTQVLQTVDAGGGHYHVDVKTPAGSGRCVVSKDGKISSVKGI